MKNIDPNLLKNRDPEKLMSSLSKEDRETVNRMLNDKAALKEMLNSPQAQAILKMLSGKSKNG